MFVFRGREAHSRSLAKAAGAIAMTEVLTKMVLYYCHESAWSSVRWGVRGDQPGAPGELRQEPAL